MKNKENNPQHKRQPKDSHYKAQMKKVFKAFYEQPKTMLMVDRETGVNRANICRYVAMMRKENRITLVREGICKISKHRAGYLTTNPKFIK